MSNQVQSRRLQPTRREPGHAEPNNVGQYVGKLPDILRIFTDYPSKKAYILQIDGNGRIFRKSRKKHQFRPVGGTGWVNFRVSV